MQNKGISRSTMRVYRSASNTYNWDYVPYNEKLGHDINVWKEDSMKNIWSKNVNEGEYWKQMNQEVLNGEDM